MILDSSRKITHKYFYDLPDLLSPKDVIVINDTKVTPTYFEIKRWRKGNTSNIRLNIIRQLDDGDWVILAKPKRRLKILDKLIFSDEDKVSADVVGLMCLKVFVNGDKNLYSELKAYAMSLGSAFQKVNFLRDLKQDHEGLNRSYFPNLNLENFDESTKLDILKEAYDENTVLTLLVLPFRHRLFIKISCFFKNGSWT